MVCISALTSYTSNIMQTCVGLTLRPTYSNHDPSAFRTEPHTHCSCGDLSRSSEITPIHISQYACLTPMSSPSGRSPDLHLSIDQCG
ncbi:hypothetical protein M404DRAFT_438470 [Pisolithus tinctorius Marx 270]|uniref:Uncharacterized protein n=1 Tax=Pisolithus tinctorius Marx 270 TaxID=870435 RepID=A0A0C3JC72_PISTI|nr:hypothetical protein M404DRAFT_438470 [Pisolithus tinctorius Marx 270]